jgi:hypothetical protein
MPDARDAPCLSRGVRRTRTLCEKSAWLHKLMKTTSFLLIPVLAVATLIASAQAIIAQTELITFDDLAPKIVGGYPIPDGYAGLHWVNFDYMNAVFYPLNPSGYYDGMVSPDYVAYNLHAQPAQLIGGTFNLNSAYLTGAWNDGLQVEVQGFVGVTLVYDHTYSVHATYPTLVNFNYLGVDKVNFVSFGGSQYPGFSHSGTSFVLDNLSITMVSPLPTLSVQPTTNGIALLWLNTGTNCRLLQNTNLASTNWVANTNAINVVNGINQATIPPTVGNMFFRLTSP